MAATKAKPDVNTELTLFGESKSVSAWAQDPRCSVDAETIAARLAQGAHPHEALCLPFGNDPGGTVGLPLKTFRSPFRGRLAAGRVSFTAWGETKLLTDWTQDFRCRATESALRGRLALGWTAEHALTTPVGATSASLWDDEFEAFGMCMTLREWSRSPQCRVKQDVLRDRVKAGWALELALSKRQAKPNRKVYVTAWGERKHLQEWVRDQRCVVSTGQITYRLRKGWNAEEALTTPGKFTSGATLREMHAAFGETKSYSEWLKDERLQVRDTVLRGRVASGWDFEKALVTPSRGKAETVRLTAFGETRTISQWIEDRRCVVSHQLLYQRTADGWDPETAITTPPLEPGLRSHETPLTFEGVTAWGETKLMRDWPADPRCKVSIEELKRRLKWGWEPEEAIGTAVGDRSRMVAKMRKTLTAFGETKTLHEWSEDPRCVVTLKTLKDRSRKDYSPEEMLTAPMGVKRRHNTPPNTQKLVTAWGEVKCVAAWAEDERCCVPLHVLYRRLGKGWEPERAMTAPLGMSLNGIAASKFLTAFGETKSQSDWARDPRCAVAGHTFEARICAGWDVERALTLPALAHGYRPDKEQVTFQTFVAFGETRTLKAWVLDARCVVSLDLVRSRLKRGWGIEEALTTPAANTGPKPPGGLLKRVA